MKIGIDFVGLAVLLAVYVVAQIRTLSLKVRYNLMGACFAGFGLYRLAKPGAKFNLILAGIAMLFAIRYFILAARSERS